MSTRIILLLAGSLLVGTANAQHKTGTTGSSKKSAEKKKGAKAHYGTASYYANKFNGRKTANGEIFDQQKLTAACNVLPLNTWVKVTNLHNKKQVVVRITDRMHPHNPRLIDLSKSAAKQLSYTGKGLTKVKVEVLGKNAHAELAQK